jgi:predicted phage-related endonuclease
VSRPFILVDVEQRSPEWFAARAGRLTASSAGDMMARIKTGEAAARRDLRTKLVIERLTGIPQEDGFVSKDMQRGIDQEPAALAEYQIVTDAYVQAVGFLQHPTLMAGCSPDGTIEDFAGVLELKCPRPANHLECIRSKGLPSRYLPQVTHALWISGAQWCDFATYCADFPENIRLFRVRIQRDDAAIAAYELMAREFLAEVDREVEEVRGLAPVGA